MLPLLLCAMATRLFIAAVVSLGKKTRSPADWLKPVVPLRYDRQRVRQPLRRHQPCILRRRGAGRRHAPIRLVPEPADSRTMTLIGIANLDATFA